MIFDRSLNGASVVVAGAGLAGLAAAHDLYVRGADVTVVEARARIGGRVLTVHEGFQEHQHGEAGADLIDEGQTTIRRLSESGLGLRLVPILDRGFDFVRRVAGRVTIDASPWQRLIEALQPLIHTFGLAEHDPHSPITAALSRHSVAEWLNEVHASEEVRAVARGMRGFFLADPDALSLLPVLEEFAGAAAPGMERMYRIEGGNVRLAERLAAPLGERVHLQSPVVSVTQDSHKVRVKVQAGKRGLTEITSDYLIVAVPAPLAAGIDWTPKLPDTQHDAFAQLKYGFATKTLLQCDRRFWQTADRAWAYGSDLAIGAAWDGNEEQAGTPGILSLLAGGSTSNATAALLERGGPEALLHELDWLGSARAHVVGFTSVRWEDDPWARGGYAYFDPAYAAEWRAWLARPFGRVLFAGEHTSVRWQGYMNGAVESGLRAAGEIAALV